MSVPPAKAIPGRPTFRELNPCGAGRFGQRRPSDYEVTTMISPTLLAQALPSASSGVDWLYQFTNNLTNLTTQNGGALTQLGLTELSCIALFTLISMVINWNTSGMTSALPYASGSRRRSDALSAAAHRLLPAHQLLGQSVSRSELRHQPFLLLHRPGDGRGLRSEFARQSAPAPEDGRRQHGDAVAHGSGPDPLLLLRAGSAGHRIGDSVSHQLQRRSSSTA